MVSPLDLTVEPGYGQPGLGYPDIVKIQDPAVATGWTFTVPGGLAMQPVTVRFRLISDANVANRLCWLQFADADGLDFARCSQPTALTAGNTAFFSFNVGAGVGITVTNSSFMAPLPDILMLPGWSLTMTVNSVQAGDQVSGVRIYCRQWPIGRSGYPLGMSPDDLDQMFQGEG